ncbi:MAG: adenylate/guanylate cyclase domain-containing protein, partial [Myxococcota bacterium]|nr:adenylate/guanylate cyclase domain-containing protein [Myxococcota bacterium]
DMTRPEYVEMAAQLRLAQEANGLHWVGIFGRDGDRLYYLVDADPANPVPINYPFFDAWPPLLAAFDGGPQMGHGLVDDYGHWDAAFAPVRKPGGEVVGVVTTLLSVTWRDVLVSRELRWLLLQIALTALGVFLAAVAFARHLARHLGDLSAGARAVAAGDLDVDIPIQSRDEVGMLAEAFGEMVRGLRERDAIRDAFGRFVNPKVADQVLHDPDSLKPGGDLREVSLLMSDLRGFTSLSERLSPSEVVTLLNAYLGQMAELVNTHGGTVVDFIGDAVMAVFGAEGEAPDDALRAANCAVEMQRVMETFNAEHDAALSMGIGLNRGQVIVGTIGSKHRMKYGVVGDSVNVTSRVESFTVGGEVLVTEDMRAVLEDQATFRGPIHIRAKGKRAALTLHAMVAIGDLLVPSENQTRGPFLIVDIPATWFAVIGSRVDETAHEGRLVALGQDDAELRTTAAIEVHDDVKVHLIEGGDEAALYAKVQKVRRDSDAHVAHLRFTALEEGASALLDRQIDATQELPMATKG